MNTSTLNGKLGWYLGWYIIDGPNRRTLMDAFEHAYDRSQRTVATFVLETGTHIDVRLSSIQHEDGFGYSFNIRGYATSIGDDKDDKVCKIYFDARSRKGFLRAVPASDA